MSLRLVVVFAIGTGIYNTIQYNTIHYMRLVVVFAVE
jgi:hypothetical protein